MRLIRLCVLLSCVLSGLASVTAMANPASKLRNFEFKHVANQAIVKVRANTVGTMALDRFHALGATVKHQFRNSGAFVLDFSNQVDAKSFRSTLLDLANDPSVEYIEANTILSMDKLPNDPRLGELYGLHNTGQTNGTAGADIDAAAAWDVSTGSRSVIVGVIDTGVNYLHPDIAPNYWNNPGEVGVDASGVDKKTNGIDDDGNGFVDDWRGWDFVNNDNDPMDDNSSYHGTHCAGTIGANGNDGVGVVGVNWQVSIVGLKFLSGAGSGTLEDAVKAIEYANTLNVTMTSNSWGGGGFSDTMAAAIQEAQNKGILFIAAAGNSGTDNDTTPHYPSSYDHDIVVSVAATDRNDRLASFSCYGANSVDLAAPGVDILSTSTADTFKVLSGTSMATPHVAGAAALIKAAVPGISAEKIKMRLMYSSDIIAATQSKTRSGGRLNVAQAVEIDTIAPGAVALGDAAPLTRNSASVAWAESGDDGDVGAAASYEVRYAATSIDSEADWAAATRKNAVTRYDEATGTYTAEIAGLPLNSRGFVAVRAYDNVGNASAVTDSVEVAVVPVRVLVTNPAESMDGLEAQGTWALEQAAGANGNAFSDSPGATTANDADFSLTLPTIQVPAGSNPALVINTKYDLERGYDFGYVEILVGEGDAAVWTKVKEFTGARDWGTEVIDLGTALGTSTQLQVRFRIKSDYSINGDGWLIDDLAVIANQ